MLHAPLSPAVGAPSRPVWPGPDTAALTPTSTSAAPRAPTGDEVGALGERQLRAAIRRHGLHAGRDLPELCAALGLDLGAVLAAHGTVFERSESPLKSRRLGGDDPSAWLGAAAGLGPAQLQLRLPGAGRLLLDGTASDLLARLPADPCQWPHGTRAWALEETLPDASVRRSLQLLDGHGQALLALRLAAGSSVPAFFDLVDRWGALDLRGTLPEAAAAAAPAAPRSTALSPAELDTLRAGWACLRRPEDAAPLLQRLGLRRVDACRLLTASQAQPLPVAALHDLLWRAMQHGLGLQLTLYNGPLALATGFVPQQLVLDGRMGIACAAGRARLLLQETALAELWCLRLNTPGGLQHRIEAFGRDGRLLLSLHDAADARRRESCAWRLLVDSIGRDADPR